MKSPVEDNQKILEKIGLFTVLFNSLDSTLSMEFFYIVNQSEPNMQPVLDFLRAQTVSTRCEILKNFTGEKLCDEIKEINNFRNFLSHGMYGVNSVTKQVSSIKLKGRTGKYDVQVLDEKLLDKYIGRIREVLNSFHQLRITRLGGIAT